MPRLYTRTGDGGKTGLLAGGRVSKADPRVESYGTVDELNAFLGAARVEAIEGLGEGDTRSFILETIETVQDGLMRLCADLASGGEAPVHADDAAILDLERRIDHATAAVPPLKNFLVPGSSRLEAVLHQARAVCRRAERRVVALGDSWGPSEIRVRYLNRVSDLLFALARLALAGAKVSERPWNPSGRDR